MKYTHTHHIVPKYLGGTDDLSNLVELTPLEHADAHNLLYHTYKNPYDRMAEIGLLGWARKEDIIREIIRESHSKWWNGLSDEDKKARNARHSKVMTGKKHSEKSKRKMSEAHTGKKLSDATKKKMSEARKKYLATCNQEREANNVR